MLIKERHLNNINSSLIKLSELDKNDRFSPKLFSSKMMLAPIQVKLPRTLKLSEDEDRKNKDYQAKIFVSRLNKEKSERAKKRYVERKKFGNDKLTSEDVVDNLLQKIDKMKMNQINLDDLKLIGINLNMNDDWMHKSQVEDLQLPPINRLKSSGESYIKKDERKKKKYYNYIGENILF